MYINRFTCSWKNVIVRHDLETTRSIKMRKALIILGTVGLVIAFALYLCNKLHIKKIDLPIGKGALLSCLPIAIGAGVMEAKEISISREELRRHVRELEAPIKITQEINGQLVAHIEEIIGHKAGEAFPYGKRFNGQEEHRNFQLNGVPEYIFKLVVDPIHGSIEERYALMILGKAVCETYHLDTLEVPPAKLHTIEVNGQRYTLLVERFYQDNDYHDNLNRFDLCDAMEISHLTQFIVHTKWSDFNVGNLLRNHQAKKWVLSDLEERRGAAIGLFGDGTWGNPPRTGLHYHVQSEENAAIVEREYQRLTSREKTKGRSLSVLKNNKETFVRNLNTERERVQTERDFKRERIEVLKNCNYDAYPEIKGELFILTKTLINGLQPLFAEYKSVPLDEYPDVLKEYQGKLYGEIIGNELLRLGFIQKYVKKIDKETNVPYFLYYRNLPEN